MLYRLKRLTKKEFTDYINEELNYITLFKRVKDPDDLLYSNEIDLSQTIIYGLIYDNIIIGFASINRETDRLNRYYITLAQRNKGHGLEFLKKLKPNSVLVRRDNSRAIKVYSRYGMVVDDTLSDKVLLTMVKLL